MKRRDFITKSAVVGATAGTTNRLFGAPASIADSKQEIIATDLPDDVKYRLSKVPVSPQYWERLSGLQAVWEYIGVASDESTNFVEDSAAYLSTKGYKHETIIKLVPEIRNLRLLSSDVLRTAVEKNDIDAVFKYLAEEGRMTTLNTNSDLRVELDKHLTNLFQLDGSDNALHALYGELGMVGDRDYSMLPGNTVVPVAAVAVVVIAVSVLVWATVATNVGAAILAALAISVAVETAITIGGPTPTPEPPRDHELVEANVVRDLTLAANVSAALGNSQLSKQISANVELLKVKVGREVDHILDLAVARGVVNFEGVDEKVVRASIQSMITKNVLLNV